MVFHTIDMKKTLAVVLAVSIAALLFAGCGRDGSEVATVPPSTSLTTIPPPSSTIPATPSGKLSNQCNQGVDGFIAAMNSLYQNMEQVYPKSFDMTAANKILVESFGGVTSRCGDNEKSAYMSEIITRLSVGRQTQGPVARAAATKTVSAMCEVADGVVTLNPQAAAACI